VAASRVGCAGITGQTLRERCDFESETSLIVSRSINSGLWIQSPGSGITENVGKATRP